MMEELNIALPKSLRDITVRQWQKYMKIYEANKENEESDFLDRKTLEIFCGVDLGKTHKVPLSTFDYVMNHLMNLFNAEHKRVDTFKLVGTDGVMVEFGLIPNLDKMSYGEYVDLEKYIVSDEDFHKALAVLYRPIAYKKGDRYLIHEYRGTEDMAEVMRDTPLDAAFAARVFFCNLARKLANYILDSTLKEFLNKKEATLESPSEENGEHTKQYILSLMDKLKDLEKLQSSAFTSV